MKKLALVLVWFLIAGWAIFAIQSYASSQDNLPSESEISELKSTYPANNNRLSAEMWDKMLDFLGRINIEVSSIWWTLTGRVENAVTTIVNRRHYMWKGSWVAFDDNWDIYQKILDHKPHFYNTWRNSLGSDRTRKNLISKSQALWLFDFCALTTVVSNWSNHICQVFTDQSYAQNTKKTTWFLYENWKEWEDGFCSVICF